jgi:hypothetical protein
MRIRTLLVAPALAGLLILTSVATSADDPKKDDPKAETKTELPPDVVPSTFRMFLVSDKRFDSLRDPETKMPLKGPDGKEVPDPKNREGKIHCLVCEYGLNPVVATFIRADAGSLDAESSVGKLLKGVDALVAKHRADKLAAFAAFLRLDFKDEKGIPNNDQKVVTVTTKNAAGMDVETKVNQYKEYPDDENRNEYALAIDKLAQKLNTRNIPYGLAAEKSQTITDWGIKNDEVTVIIYYRMRIVGQWRFAKAADLTPEKVAEILKATEEAFAGKKVRP